jgi:predicted transcriptional regulator
MKQTKINTQLIVDYRKLIEELPRKIEENGLKKEYIIKVTKMPKSTFYHKLANGTFTPEELIKISNVINNE